MKGSKRITKGWAGMVFRLGDPSPRHRLMCGGWGRGGCDGARFHFPTMNSQVCDFQVSTYPVIHYQLSLFDNHVLYRPSAQTFFFSSLSTEKTHPVKPLQSITQSNQQTKPHKSIKMRSAIALSLAAIAGSALAAPSNYGNQVKDVHVVVETVVHTVYYTEGQPQATPTPSPEQYYEAPAVTSAVYEAPAPTSSAVYVAPTYEAAPAPQPSSTKPAAPVATGSGYQGIVDKWRAKLNLKPLINSKKLEDNAMNTVIASNGEMIHKLNAGTFGQVLAPGDKDDFEHVFVGGWLCEIPTLPGLDGICQTQSAGWTYQGQTGHAEILTSPNYSEIGCAFNAGIWCCDLA
ncbi:hypothetical protein T440DRAFT_201841 [Plenodomus tracheiphilus IPT5]|uniref:SCP domain-containing protein n=1 Tax=Plenodomus tracheiphilus IPT5 TaxID=1408161 RepID=A0A6A7BLJ6_9PLEO|nr:hypothetical protein T440DRAFT_201841 [Plenodomus tracheiphilus IPT5]